MASISKKKISDIKKIQNKGQNNPFYGKRHSEETKKVIGQKVSVAITGEKNPFYGKNHSEETKSKISNKLIGHEPGNKIKLSDDQIKDFINRIIAKETLNSIAEVFNLGLNTVCRIRNELIEDGRLNDCRYKKRSTN